jgi:hypothetical protein
MFIRIPDLKSMIQSAQSPFFLRTQDRYGRNRSFLGNVSQGVHLFKVPADTQLLAFSHLCVFARCGWAIRG